MSLPVSLLHYYQTGGSLLLDSPTYVTRKADQDLYEGLKGGEFCYVLNARQMGKSSLKVQTMQRLQAEGVACAAIDITEIGTANVTPEQWYAGMINILVNSFSLYETFDLDNWWMEHTLLSPVQRFSQFIENILLKLIPGKIVILIDEIDSVLSLEFKIDDFFAIIRDCYNRRADKPAFRNLTFALIGVATPADLIQDKRRTPFNIGRSIELTGFQLHEAQPLAQGFSGIIDHPEVVLQSVLNWTGGQPFLTQRVCRLILQELNSIERTDSTLHHCKPEWVVSLVRSRVIENWEAQDESAHLKTIRDRILRSSGGRTGKLLGLYQQIIQKEGISADDSPAQLELRLTGLVVKREGKLRVYNAIYASVFNQVWLQAAFAELRPYSDTLMAWVDSGCEDESRLLRGQALADAQAWASNKSLSDQDYRFLNACRELAKREVEKDLAAQKQANQILAVAHHKASQRIRAGTVVLGVALVGAAIAGLSAGKSFRDAREAQIDAREAQVGARLEQQATETLQQFERGQQLDALLDAMQAGRELQTLVEGDRKTLARYPAGSPLLTLRTILDQIQERNRWMQANPNAIYAGFSGDGQAIITAGADGTVQVRSRSGQRLNEFKNVYRGQDIWSVSISSTGQHIATAGSEGAALWNWSGQKLTEFKGHSGIIRSISFSPDGQQLATVSEDRTIRIWNISGQPLTTINLSQGNPSSVSFSRDGRLLAIAQDDGTVQLWNPSGKPLAKFKAAKGNVLSLSVSPDGQRIAIAPEHGTLSLWDRSSGQVIPFNLTLDQVYSVNFSPDARHLVTLEEYGTVRLWDLPRTMLTKFKSDPNKRVLQVSFSPNGHQIATLEDDRAVRLWSLSGQKIVELKGDKGNITGMSFSPDGGQIATREANGTIRVWNFAKQAWTTTFKAHQGNVYSVSFSPDGQQLATAGGDGTARLWDVSGKSLAEFKAHQGNVYSVSFSPDGQQLATGGDGTARLWDRSGKSLAEFNAHQGEVWSVSFSPDGKQLATAGKDGTARLWNRSRQQSQLKGHRGSVYSVRFSPDGQQIGTVGKDGTTRLWDHLGRQLAKFEGSKGNDALESSVSFSPDGKQMAIVGPDGGVQLVPIETLEQLLSRGCNWLSDYLNNLGDLSNPPAAQNSHLCPSQKPKNS